ncbi:unnamed protein product [marine sediment metagenome]|uniref:DUF2335 domain-containing protein n=1 Tax=marine sediment metagenome TaxID=412755 RepID=X1SFL8_9ZZZZ
MEQKDKNAKVPRKLAKNQEPEEDILPEEISEIVKKLPPEQGETIKKSMEFMMSAINVPYYSPLLRKLSGEHIDKIIEYSEKDDERSFKFALISKRHALILTIFGMGIFIFLTVFLAKDSSNIYMDILKVAFGFLGGFGVGSFFKKKQE